MATVRSSLVASLLIAAGCGDLQGFGGDVPPLATMQFEAMGDFEAVRIPGANAEALRIALVWGAQWLSESTCYADPATDELALVVAEGCRNPLAFTPNRVGASVSIEPNVPVELSLFALPAADVMVGGVASRVAYGSFVVFDDRDGTGSLELASAEMLPAADQGAGGTSDIAETADIIYGASFVAMTEPDIRVAFREGEFDPAAAFYPRSGCSAPPAGFSILAAGGFTLADAIAAAAAGTLPEEDPATCSETEPGAAVVAIPFRSPEELSEVGCAQRTTDGRVRYREPVDDTEQSLRTFACRTVPGTQVVELVAATHRDDFASSRETNNWCMGVQHFTLRGCSDPTELLCEGAAWDLTAEPPAWWPCPEAP